ncbi:hypothetical protein BLA29_002995, partial [Euroglyphus maynei]
SATTTTTTSTTTTIIANHQQQPSSQLLSNLIQETILNDQEQSSNQIDDNNGNDDDGKNSKQTKSGHSKPSPHKTCSVPNENGEKIKPTKNSRSTAVLVDDPHKIDEVLKELKIRGRRAGRPVNKFMYNHHPNRMLNMNNNSVSQQTQSTSKPTVLLTVRASNLRQSADGTIPKQIVLTATTNDVKNPDKSVMIPIQLETTTNTKSSTTDSTTYLQLMPLKSSIQIDSAVPLKETDKTNEWFSNPNLDDGSFMFPNGDYHQSSSSSMAKTAETVESVPLAPLPTDVCMMILKTLLLIN